MLPTDTEKSHNIMIVAGEASGDLHGSNLIHAASKHYPQFEFFGVGGEKMQRAGCQIIFPADELAVMGLVEVVGRLPKIWRRFKQLKQIINGKTPPELLILIDFPDFNLRLAKV
ncbi:MAG: lipid-A-disaccharide synthase, partial [Desulfuromonadales bacterium]|nr:lipid-A-disaccharide synthase [Desulfuromonadales bacterium]